MHSKRHARHTLMDKFISEQRYATNHQLHTYPPKYPLTGAGMVNYTSGALYKTTALP